VLGRRVHVALGAEGAEGAGQDTGGDGPVGPSRISCAAVVWAGAREAIQ